MVDDFTFEMKGLDGLLAKMKSINYDLRKKGGRAALRKAAKVWVNAAKQNASRLDDPATAEKIYANIAERWDNRFNKSTGDLKFKVGVLGGAKQYADNSFNRRKGRVGEKHYAGGSTWYWRFLEFGTRNMSARPFMRPAMTGNIDAATNVFILEYGKAIDSAIKRSSK